MFLNFNRGLRAKNKNANSLIKELNPNYHEHADQWRN